MDSNPKFLIRKIPTFELRISEKIENLLKITKDRKSLIFFGLGILNFYLQTAKKVDLL
jgi:hypothetical protein